MNTLGVITQACPITQNPVSSRLQVRHIRIIGYYVQSIYDHFHSGILGVVGAPGLQTLIFFKQLCLYLKQKCSCRFVNLCEDTKTQLKIRTVSHVCHVREYQTRQNVHVHTEVNYWRVIAALNGDLSCHNQQFVIHYGR